MFRAIYKTGSSLFLPNSNDLDFVCYYDSDRECKEALITNHDRNVNKHFCTVSNATRIILGCYIYHYMELVEGEEIPALQNFSIFDENTKERYLNILRRYSENLRTNDKRWYHIVTAMFLYQNNDYNLTNEQLEVIQSVHDNGITVELRSEIGGFLCQ